MNKVKDLKNQRFGQLTVIGDYITIRNTRNRQERKWLCLCDCGTEKYILERSLLYGGTKSCGCLTRINSAKANAYDLHGKTFGELEVLNIAKDHPKDARGGVWWHCKCSCGNEIDVLASLLVTGRKAHCGCKADPQYYSVDITDRQFGRLTAKYPLKDRERKGGVVWHCKCECGNEVDIPYNWLMYSGMQSCGCQRREHEQSLSTYLTHVNGTSLDMIRSKKVPNDNTTGYRGVYLIKGKYVAKIVFQKKAYYLGVYDNIEEAAEARKEAEELLFDGATAHYERWKIKADADPEWAANNPVEIIVSKKSASELNVTFLPVMT